MDDNNTNNSVLAQSNNQDDSSSGGQNKQQDDQKPVSIRVGGVEGGSFVLEQAGSSSQETGQEISKPVERAQEKAPERAPEQQKPAPVQTKKPTPVKKEKLVKSDPDPISEKVFGYKVPSVIAKNYKSIPSKASRADTRKGLDCLYMFLDRLLRMKS